MDDDREAYIYRTSFCLVVQNIQVYSVVSSELCQLAFDINARGVLGVCMYGLCE